jgi:hypothetical protein
MLVPDPLVVRVVTPAMHEHPVIQPVRPAHTPGRDVVIVHILHLERKTAQTTVPALMLQ